MLPRDQVTITPCRCGRLVRLAHRWESYCASCDEPITTGAVGAYTWDDCRSDGSGMHDIGAVSHQHGCGQWNPPIEVTVQIEGDLEEAIQLGLEQLTEAVRLDKEATREWMLINLEELVDKALAHLPDHDSGCSNDCMIQSTWDLNEGVYIDHEEHKLVAWAWDRTAQSDEAETPVLEVERSFER